MLSVVSSTRRSGERIRHTTPSETNARFRIIVCLLCALLRAGVCHLRGRRRRRRPPPPRRTRAGAPSLPGFVPPVAHRVSECYSLLLVAVACGCASASCAVGGSSCPLINPSWRALLAGLCPCRRAQRRFSIHHLHDMLAAASWRLPPAWWAVVLSAARARYPPRSPSWRTRLSGLPSLPAAGHRASVRCPLLLDADAAVVLRPHARSAATRPLRLPPQRSSIWRARLAPAAAHPLSGRCPLLLDADAADVLQPTARSAGLVSAPPLATERALPRHRAPVPGAAHRVSECVTLLLDVDAAAVLLPTARWKAARVPSFPRGVGSAAARASAVQGWVVLYAAVAQSAACSCIAHLVYRPRAYLELCWTTQPCGGGKGSRCTKACRRVNRCRFSGLGVERVAERAYAAERVAQRAGGRVRRAPGASRSAAARPAPLLVSVAGGEGAQSATSLSRSLDPLLPRRHSCSRDAASVACLGEGAA